MRGRRQDSRQCGRKAGTVERPWTGAGDVMEMGRCVTAVMGYRACRMPALRKPDLCSSALQTLAQPYLLKPEQFKFFWVIMSVTSGKKM